LAAMPEILDVAVVGTDVEDSGPRLIAIVQPEDGNVGRSELWDLIVRKAAADGVRPLGSIAVVAVQDLGRPLTGKLKKAVLLDNFRHLIPGSG
jgi:hypothetical protein